MRVAFVTPRYGPEVIGGAESAMRMIAERLVSQLGWDVDAYTSYATDYVTWENVFPPGQSELAGVRVRRFATRARRGREFGILSERILPSPGTATPQEAERWVELQGPRCPELVTALAESEADIVAFSPYLYYPAVYGLPVVARRSILHPAAHDEVPIYLPCYRELFQGAAGFIFNATWEQGFVHRRFHVAGRPELVLGLGVDDPDEAAVAARRAQDPLALGGRPYLCCLGRVDGSKGTPLLVELFRAYKQLRPGPLALVLVGPVATATAPDPDVVVAGAVDEVTKWALLDGSLATVAPSPFESFAIVLLEAWTRRKAVLVNGQCAATTEQSVRSGGGLAFTSFSEFVAALDRLVSDDELRSRLGEQGRRYVDANYRWPLLIERWGRFAEMIAGRAG